MTDGRFRAPSIQVLALALILLGGITGAAAPGTRSASAQSGSIAVTSTGSSYWVAGASPRAQVQSGQRADILLSGIGFNNTGGPLLFNHLGGIASDGKRLVVADRNNNRILLWDSLPTGNVSPDLVLGQKSFSTDNPGTGLGQLDWPTAVAMTPGGGVVVADTYNNRILIWNSFPTSRGQPADVAIYGAGGSGTNLLRDIIWPWGVWTNGTLLAVSSTSSGTLLVWKHFPTQNNQSADYAITANGEFVTPRAIISDSTSLLVYDHNARASGCQQMGGTLVWKSFPSSDRAPDYCMPSDEYFDGAFGSDGKLWADTVPTNSQGQPYLTSGSGEGLFTWNTLPVSGSTPPDMMNPGSNGFMFFAGDTSGMAIIGSKMLISMDNGNRIVGYNQLPTSSNQNPDFAVGSPDIYTNTLTTNFVMSNPQPITDGKSLFVVSDFDSMLYVYKNIPDQSNAHPDIVYNLASMQPIQGALYGNTFVLVGQQGGQQTVYIWNSLPFGQGPDTILQGGMGSVSFQNLAGVALDGKYLYLSDSAANKVYVFQSLPTSSSNPIYTISFNQPERLSSDGTYLAVVSAFGESSVAGPPYGPNGPLISASLYTVSELSSSSQPVSLAATTAFSPLMALLSNGKLFMVDKGYDRVQVWDSVSKALAGNGPNVTLGCTLSTDRCSQAQIGINKLFWPAFASYDGDFLWVGEYKFSEQLLRFSGAAPSGSQTFTLFYNRDNYSIPVSSSTSTISDLSLYPQNSTIRLRLSEGQASGSTTVTFASGLLAGVVSGVTVDGTTQAAKVTTGGSTTSVQVSYPSGSHTVEIFAIPATTTSATTTMTTSTTTSTTSASTATSTATTPLSSSTSTTTLASPTSSSSSNATSSSSSTTPTTTSSTTTGTPAQSTASSSTSATSSGSGGVPEFSTQLVVSSTFAAVLVGSYLLIKAHRPVGTRAKGSKR